MDGQLVELWVTTEQDPRADDAEIEGRTLELREELLELDIEDARQPPGGSAPDGSRGAEVALLGTLLVTTTREVVGAVVRTVAAWLSRTGGRTVKMQLGDDSIELTNVAEEDQRQLLEAFLARHTDPAL
jgi:hypothetical protein